MEKTDQLPDTGRIGRFVKILRAETEPDTCGWILEGAERYRSLAAADKSAWWNSAVRRMEARLGRDGAARIMRQCGALCCGKGQRRTGARLFRETGSVEAFLDHISRHDVKEGDLTYTLEDEHTVIMEYHRCFCRQAAKGQTPFDSLTYCQCSAAFNEAFFGAALGKAVRVEMLQSIICGAGSCKFKITF